MLIQNSQYDFWDNFPEFYSTPEKINKALELNSKKIERMVATLFKENNLHQEYSLYANGGFGKQEMFPSSDIDISIHTEIVQQKQCIPKDISGLAMYVVTFIFLNPQEFLVRKSTECFNQ